MMLAIMLRATIYATMIKYNVLGRDAVYKISGWKPIYFISLVGTDASDQLGKGYPRKALSFFDIFSEMEFEEIDGITFLSVQDLLEYYQEQTGKDGEDMDGYQLVIFFMQQNINALYFIDEVPLIRIGNLYQYNKM